MADLQDKLSTLVGAARFDACSACGTHDAARFIYHAALPAGGTASLLKVLLTNVCVNDCAYCCNQVGRDITRRAFRPEELAKTFMELHAKRMVQGLFLSSGIGHDASRTMGSMIDTVQILRQRFDFRGYVHLKILPGASRDCVAEACRLASRVSVNIEAPTAQHLARLTARKDLYQGILDPMRWVKQIKESDDRLVPSGQTTQFVVGAAGETDRDILHTTEGLYREMGLRRAYFSAFHPVAGSRLEGVDAAPPMREHRLYQADWLLRVYGFRPGEIDLALGKRGNLSLTRDPKLVIALNQPWLFPVDINRASYDELLRVPGIGPVSAGRIVDSRQSHSIGSLQQLKKMRARVGQAAAFIRFQGMLGDEKQSSFLRELDTQREEPAPSLCAVRV